MKYKLYAFWKHDIPPYVLGGEVTEIKSNGRVCVKGFTGYSFLPLQILPLEEGRAKQKEIDLALKNYKNTIKKAEEELRSYTKQLLLKYTLTEIGHEHVNDFLKECSAKRKEILDAGIDTACQTSLPTKADILLELNDGENIGGSGEYDSDWAVTDNTAEDFAYVKCRLPMALIIDRKTKKKEKNMKATNTLYQEENNMKVFYLAQVNFGCVVYADNKNDAFEKIKCQRKELLETLGLPLDITRWGIVEFTPDLYDGVLCFY